MTLPLDVSSDSAQVGAVAGMMLGAGYLIASLSPFALGAVRDATGSFTGTLWVIVGTACVLLVLCSTLTPERLRRGIAVEQPASV
jgi:CP family cyanate transporter-like MFS transporter